MITVLPALYSHNESLLLFINNSLLSTSEPISTFHANLDQAIVCSCHFCSGHGF